MNKWTIALIICAGALAGPAMAEDAYDLAGAKQCFICHDATSGGTIGPSFRSIARRYNGVSNAKSMLAEVIQTGSEGRWAASRMPPASARVPVSREEAEMLAAYVLSFEHVEPAW